MNKPLSEYFSLKRRYSRSINLERDLEKKDALVGYIPTERLGLQGYGPEVSMYYSVLGETGIHSRENGEWGFYPPNEISGVWTAWQAIDDFCCSAKDKQETLDKLYQTS